MKLLSRLFKGTPVTPRRTDTPEWHPLDELDEPVVTAHKLTLRDGEIRRACDPPHGPDRRCFECATDDELASAIPPPPVADPAQCTAPTKTGRPCSKPPRPGSDRCTLPAHQRT